MVVGLVVLLLLQSICGGNALDFMVADEGDGKSTMGILCPKELVQMTIHFNSVVDIYSANSFSFSPINGLTRGSVSAGEMLTRLLALHAAVFWRETTSMRRHNTTSRESYDIYDKQRARDTKQRDHGGAVRRPSHQGWQGYYYCLLLHLASSGSNSTPFSFAH